MRPRALVAGGLLCALAGCSGAASAPTTATTGASGPEFEVRATVGGLELTNRGSTTVYYRALDPLSLALSDRIPCLEPGRCPGVAGHSRVTIPYDEAIVGYRLDTDRATVFWWHLLPQPDGSVVADEVRSLDLRL